MRLPTLLGLSVLGVLVTIDAASLAKAGSAPPVSWSGFYIGFNGGNAALNDNSTLRVISGSGNLAVPPGTTLYGGNLDVSPDASEPFIGAQIGRNWQFAPNWIAGLEADIQTGVGGRKQCIVICNSPVQIAPGFIPSIFPIVFSENTYSLDINWLATFRGRLGYATGPALFYVTGGLAVADVERRSRVEGVTTIIGVFPINGFSGSFSESSVKKGWTLGAGVEGQLNSNLSVKAEYLYADLGSVTDRFETNFTAGILFGPGAAATRTVRSELKEHIVRLGLNYRFNALIP